MKGTVFLLEDDKSICELVRCALEMADIDTVCFNTVADFNAALNQHLPAVALLDIMLPDGSGLDVLKKAQTELSSGRLHHAQRVGAGVRQGKGT